MEENLDIDFNKYKKYKYKYIKLKNKLEMKGGGKLKTLYLFKADWCPHCVQFKDVWMKLKTELPDIEYITYDYDKNKKEMKEYQITSYPTIMLKINDTLIEYKGQRTFDNIKKFINSNNIL